MSDHDTVAIDTVDRMLGDLARANGPVYQGHEYVGICIDTRVHYKRELVDFVNSDVLDLTPVGHDHFHREGAEPCGWRGWNVGVVKRKWLVRLLEIIKDDVGAEQMKTCRQDRFAVVIVCEFGAAIVSIPTVDWHLEIHKQASADPLISLRGSQKPS